MAIITLQSTHTPSGKSRIINLTTIAAPQPGDWPDNEPANFDPIIFLNGSSKVIPGTTHIGSRWADDEFVEAGIADPASKHGQVIEKRHRVGDTSGWNGVVIFDIGRWTELYQRYVYAVSDNYMYHPTGGVGGKMCYYNTPGSEERGYEFIIGNDRPGLIDGGPSPGGQYLPLTDPNDISAIISRISRVTYHTLEVHQRAALTPGTGFLRFWFDGVEYTHFQFSGQGQITQFQNFTWDATKNAIDKRIGGKIEGFWFWGGSGATKNVNDFVRFSEIKISGRK